MKIVGVIREYNPFHNGHARQLRLIRELLGQDTVIVCAMSGSFVQRGAPAVFHKSLRAEAAVRCGADLVLELPVNTCLSSAEGFAAGGVEILGRLCTHLCFGSESGSTDDIMSTAEALLSPEFPGFLRAELDRGLSFPAARQQALAAMGFGAGVLEKPNDILAVEYCKAIRNQGLALTPLPLRRGGDYHAAAPEAAEPSATSLRTLIHRGEALDSYIPEAAAELFRGAAVHSLEAGERAMLYRLRSMTDAEFEALPYSGEGLWRKLMHEARRQATLEDILTAVKSKRYTRTRLDRMVMCAFLGLDQNTLAAAPDYTRVLAFNDRGRQILSEHRKSGCFLHTGEKTDHPHWAVEQRCEALYGLFTENAPEQPNQAEKTRVVYVR